MRALLDETQQEFQEVARDIAQTIGIQNPSDIADRDSFAGWETLASAGLLELRERSDGEPTASGVEIALLAQELGGALAPEPYLPSAVIAGDLIARSGDGAGWMTGLGAGADRYGVLLSPGLDSIGSPGAASVIWGGAGDDGYVLALRAEGDGYRLVRGTSTGAARLESVSPTSLLWRTEDVQWEDGGPLTADDVQRVVALGLTVVAADTVGALDTALTGVVEYSKQRTAYGQHIGSFQAIQHIAANALVSISGARSAMLYAAWAVDILSPAEALLAARTAKAAAAAVGRPVAEDVMQMYGGIGQTWEHIAHFFTRRAIFDAAVLGDEDHQLDLIAAARLGGN